MNAFLWPFMLLIKTIMFVNQHYITNIKKTLLTAAAVLALCQCSEEDFVPAKPETQSENSISASDSKVSSITIAGVHTYFSTARRTDISFTVPADAGIIDGKALNLKPGAVIALDPKLSYGDLEFVNMMGTAEQPIIITTNVKEGDEKFLADMESPNLALLERAY